MASASRKEWILADLVYVSSGFNFHDATHLMSTQLLVSVRDAAEANIALAAGVDWIDVKEPAAGPLGAASPETIAAVFKTIGGRAPASAALGELAEWNRSPFEIPRPPGGRPLHVKLGLAGCGRDVGWGDRWRRTVAALPGHVRPVAVIYADRRAAHSPRPQEILAAAGEVDCSAVLVDTYAKDGKCLLDHWNISTVVEFVRDARRRGMLVVLAGSLAADSIEVVAGARNDGCPDYVAVRGAVCRAGRTSTLCPARISELLARLSAIAGLRSAPASAALSSEA